MQAKDMVEKFQCPGCVCGMDVTCGAYVLDDEYGNCCKGHVLGTMLGLGNHIALGLPKGFNKPGFTDDRMDTKNKIVVRLWPCRTQPEWDHLNLPVWAYVEDGFLFVRTYSPRINDSYVDVIESGDLSLAPNAIDVSNFYDQID